MVRNELSSQLDAVEHLALIGENYVGIHLVFVRELNDGNEVVDQAVKQLLLNL